MWAPQPGRYVAQEFSALLESLQEDQVSPARPLKHAAVPEPDSVSEFTGVTSHLPNVR
jgi:hypothetical protein